MTKKTTEVNTLVFHINYQLPVMPGFLLNITQIKFVYLRLFPHEQLVNKQLFPQTIFLCLEMSKGEEMY